MPGTKASNAAQNWPLIISCSLQDRVLAAGENEMPGRQAGSSSKVFDRRRSRPLRRGRRPPSGSAGGCRRDRLGIGELVSSRIRGARPGDGRRAEDRDPAPASSTAALRAKRTGSEVEHIADESASPGVGISGRHIDRRRWPDQRIRAPSAGDARERPGGNAIIGADSTTRSNQRLPPWQARMRDMQAPPMEWPSAKIGGGQSGSTTCSMKASRSAGVFVKIPAHNPCGGSASVRSDMPCPRQSKVATGIRARADRVRSRNISR